MAYDDRLRDSYDDDYDEEDQGDEEDEENDEEQGGEEGEEGNEEQGEEEQGNEEENDEDDEDDGQGKGNSVKEKKKQLERTVKLNILRAKLMAIQLKLILPSKTSLTPSEEKTMTDAAKYPELLGLTTKIRTKVMANKVKAEVGKKSWGAAIVAAVAVLLLIVLLVVVCAVPVQALSGDGETAAGVSGEGFYGIRMVYKDEERAKNDLIENYLAVVEHAIESVAGKSVDGETITIDIDMLDEGDEIDYATFENDYPELSPIVLKIAQVVSAADNGSTSAATLEECLSEINYFGLPKNEVNKIASDISDFIEASAGISSDVSGLINSNLGEFTTRTEMYYIKDYIFKSAEEMQSGVEAQQYVAFIFMPKRNVEFKSVSFKVVGENLDGINCDLTYNQSALNLVEDSRNYNDEESGLVRKIYEYTSGVSVSAFQDIDTGNVDVLSDGLSLYDIFNSDELNSDLYLTNGESVEVYTYKNNGLSLNLTFEEGVEIKPFKVNENVTDWS